MKHDPNLFEAFKDVSERGAEQEAPAPAPMGLGGGGGRPIPVIEPRLGLLVLVLMLASFGAGWLLRGPGEGVLAKGPGTEGGEAVGEREGPGGGSDWLGSGGSEGWAPDVDPGGGNSGSGEVSAASGLYKPTNIFTVLAITYADLPSLESRARTTAQYLRDQGFPAFDPVRNGDKIEILIGAAPTRSELQEVLTRLQGTRGPEGGGFDFQSAMPVRIDHRVDR